MTFLGKMMRTKSKLLPLAVAVVIAPLLLSENAAAQDVNIHPSDLFETPRKASRQHYQGAQEIQTAGRTTLTCLLMRVLVVKAMSSLIIRE